MNTSSPGEEEGHVFVSTSYAILSTIAFGLLTTITLLILAYLRNVTLAVEGFLLYLYKEFLLVAILLGSMFELFLLFSYVFRNGLYLDDLQAKIVAFCTWCLTQYLLILLNLISTFKLYMTKTKMLDPPLPFGMDDYNGFNALRAACVTISIGFTSGMYVLGVYPQVYYLLRGPDVLSNPIPIGVTLSIGVCAFLLITFLLTCIAARLCTSTDCQMVNSMLRKQLNSLLIASMVIFGSMILLWSLIYQNWSPIQDFNIMDQWKLVYGINQIVHTIIGANLIWRTPQVKSYVFKLLKDTLDEAFFLSIFIVPLLLALCMYLGLYVTYRCLRM